MLEESHHYFNKAADLLSLSERVRKILITPLLRVSGAAQQHSRAL